LSCIAEILAAAADQITSDTARLDAELLLSEVLGKDRSYFFTWPEKVISSDAQAKFNSLLKRRIEGEPVAYILGRQGFWDLDLQVRPSTLIPRPDTEVLVECALQLHKDEPLMVLDIGTGTGAIALALKKERPTWRVLAADFNLDACQLARSNAHNNKLDVTVFCGDWLAAVAPDTLDILISNPPYIAAEDHHLQEGDVRFEPHSALVAERQGLADIECIAKQAISVLKTGGYILLEHGYDQRQRVSAILETQGFINISCIKDYGDNWRATLAQKASDE